MDEIPVFVDAVKTSVCTRIAPRHMVAVVGKLLAGREARRFPDDPVAFDHQTRAVRVQYDPFAAQQCDAAIGGILNRDEIDEGVRLVRRQARAAVVVAQLVK